MDISYALAFGTRIHAVVIRYSADHINVLWTTHHCTKEFFLAVVKIRPFLELVCYIFSIFLNMNYFIATLHILVYYLNIFHTL